MVKPKKDDILINNNLNLEKVKNPGNNPEIFNGVNGKNAIAMINGLMKVVLDLEEHNDLINNILTRLFKKVFKRNNDFHYVNFEVNRANKLECCLSFDDSKIYKRNSENRRLLLNVDKWEYPSHRALDLIEKIIIDRGTISTKDDLDEQIEKNKNSYETKKPILTKIYFSWGIFGTLGNYSEDDAVKMFRYLYEYQKDIKCPEILKLVMIRLLKDILGNLIFFKMVNGFEDPYNHDMGNIKVYAKSLYAADTIQDILTDVLKIPPSSISYEGKTLINLNEKYKHTIKIKVLDNPIGVDVKKIIEERKLQTNIYKEALEGCIYYRDMKRQLKEKYKSDPAGYAPFKSRIEHAIHEKL